MTGLKILIVEDDPLMSATILDALQDAGHVVIGTPATVHEALDLARFHQFQLAVLDYDLNGDPASPLAWLLTTRRIPTIVFSGIDRTAIPNTLPDTCISVSKSQGLPALVRAVDRVARHPI